MSAAAAAPAVAPVHQPAPKHVVRLRVSTHAWTSPGMPRVDAETLAATLTKQLVDIGDTGRFVTFKGRDGKLFEIRGREILAVEVTFEGSDDRRPNRGIRGVGVVDVRVVDVQVPAERVPVGLPADGTEWLKQHARGHQ